MRKLFVLFLCFSLLLGTMPMTGANAQEATGWQLIENTSGNSRFIVSTGAMPIVVQTHLETGKDRVLYNEAGVWSVTLDQLPTIDAIAKDLTGRVYLLSSANGGVAYSSMDNGKVWTPVSGFTLPTDGTIKGVSVIKGEQEASTTWVVAMANHLGLYQSKDNGQTWAPIAQLDPTIEVNGLYEVGNLHYVATKQSGVWVTPNFENFTTLAENKGLSDANALNVTDVVIGQQKLYINTLSGIYALTFATVTDGFKKVSGLSGQSNQITLINEVLYAISSDKQNVYKMTLNGEMKAFKGRGSADVGLLNALSSVGDSLLAASTKGLVSMANETVDPTPTEVAAGITTVEKPKRDQTQITLPTVPNGFGISMLSSSQPNVIATTGAITVPDKATKVSLTLRVFSLSNPSVYADTAAISVEVDGKPLQGNVVYKEGTGQGRNGDIKVKVTLLDGAIYAIDILSHSESVSGYSFSPLIVQALTQIPQQVIQKQSLSVDVVTSASKTSRGILNAIINALQGTKYAEDLDSKNWTKFLTSSEVVYLADLGANWLSVAKSKTASTIDLVSANGSPVSHVEMAKLIDSGIVLDSGEVLLLGSSKDVKVLLKSTDNGATWTEMPAPTGLQTEKVESMFQANGKLYAILNKYGLFTSEDKGQTWVNANGDLPKSPDKATEYDLRRILKLEDGYYLITKKQGVLRSTDLVAWTAVPTTGMTTEAKVVWSATNYQGKLLVAGTAGAWTYDSKAATWSQLTGFTGDSRALILGGQKLYMVAKTLDVYETTGTSFTKTSGLPLTYIAEEPKINLVKGNTIIMGYKTGVMGYTFPTTSGGGGGGSKDTDAVSGATGKGGGGSKEVEAVTTPAAKTETTPSGPSKIALEAFSKVIDGGKTLVKLTLNETTKSTQKEPLVLNYEGTTQGLTLTVTPDLLRQTVNNGQLLKVETSALNYELPSDLMKRMASEQPNSEMVLAIEVLKAEDLKVQSTYTLMGSPIQMTLSAVNPIDQTRTEYNEFGNLLVKRYLPLTGPVDLSKITGVVYENGKWLPVPTRFVETQGQTYAVIERNSNSIYAIASRPMTFADTKNHWASEAINSAAAKGLISGNGAKFLPNSNVTRAEYASMLFGASGMKGVVTTGKIFTDVKANDWFSEAVESLTFYGVIDNANKFRANEAITREEMAYWTAKLSAWQKTGSATLSEAPAKYLDGSYKGETTGPNGKLLAVQMAVENGKIAKVEWTSLEESTEMGKQAILSLSSKVVKAQSTEVDTVSGATLSSKAGLTAMTTALNQALNTGVKDDLAAYKDKDKVSSWAVSALTEMKANGYISGYNDMTIRPKGTLTRAEAASILYKVFCKTAVQ